MIRHARELARSISNTAWISIPLFVFAAGLLACFDFDGDGFALNLATELLGILVTVVFVDTIIQQQRQAQREHLDRALRGRVAEALEFAQLRARTMAFTIGLTNQAFTEELPDGAAPHLREADRLVLAEKAGLVVADVNELLSLFGSQLGPDFQVPLIEVRKQAKAILYLLEDVARTATGSPEVESGLREWTAERVRRLFREAKDGKRAVDDGR